MKCDKQHYTSFAKFIESFTVQMYLVWNIDMLFQALGINSRSRSIFYFLNQYLAYGSHLVQSELLFLIDCSVKILSAIVLVFSELVFSFLMLLTCENICSRHADEFSEQIKFSIH